LTGPSVSGNGLLLNKMSGRLFGEVVLGQPTTFIGEAAGHLWRATMGVRFSTGTIGVSVSDFARPDGGYSTLAPELDPTLDPDSLEMLERERELSTGAASTRVRGFGVEANLRISPEHRLLLRVGGLRLGAVGGEEVRRPSLEAQYSFSSSRVFLNTRLRRMPPTVQGVYLPGNEVSLDGNLRLIGPLRLTARAYRYENETLGETTGFAVNGGSLGLGLASNRWRLDVRGYHRTMDYSTRTVRRTGQVVLGLALGSWSISTASEVGRETGPGGGHPFRSQRGDLRVKADPGYASFAVRTYETNGLGSRLRADLLGSATFGGFEVAGGAWATRGWTLGGEPGAWMHLGVPLYYQFTALVGLGKGLVLPIPFTGADTGVPHPPWSGSETAGWSEANTSPTSGQ
jgi:hypothetical protein